MSREMTGLQEDWFPITMEERICYNILFYSQAPVDGLLSGEKARDLFLMSGLPLPQLSQIWNLADLTADNILDLQEFAVAMHLLQSCIRGSKLPKTLPEALMLLPAAAEQICVQPITARELKAYDKLFQALDSKKTGLLDAKIVRDVLLTSELPADQLAMIWNLSDTNRDGRLNQQEFAVACHLLRHVKEGNALDSSVNVYAILPQFAPPHTWEARTYRMSEFTKRKQKLMAFKERRKNEQIRENKRLELEREKLKLMKLQFKELKEKGMLGSSGSDCEEVIQSSAASVAQVEAVANRLHKEHEIARQDAARVIIEEQRLADELNIMQNEADGMKKRQARLDGNRRATREIDPFHQLHEQKKEEKLTGIRTPRKENTVYVPFQDGPFDKDFLERKTILSGEDIFLNCNSESGPWTSAISSKEANLNELTLGFKDNFVDAWDTTDSVKRENKANEINANYTDHPFESDEEDPVFQTVSVTEEEDDLWCSLIHGSTEYHDQVAQDESLTQLQNKMADIRSQIRELNKEGGKLVFRHPHKDGSTVDESAVPLSQRIVAKTLFPEERSPVNTHSSSVSKPQVTSANIKPEQSHSNPQSSSSSLIQTQSKDANIQQVVDKKPVITASAGKISEKEIQRKSESTADNQKSQTAAFSNPRPKSFLSNVSTSSSPSAGSTSSGESLVYPSRKKTPPNLRPTKSPPPPPPPSSPTKSPQTPTKNHIVTPSETVSLSSATDLSPESNSAVSGLDRTAGHVQTPAPSPLPRHQKKGSSSKSKPPPPQLPTSPLKSPTPSVLSPESPSDARKTPQRPPRHSKSPAPKPPAQNSAITQPLVSSSRSTSLTSLVSEEGILAAVPASSPESQSLDENKSAAPANENQAPVAPPRPRKASRKGKVKLKDTKDQNISFEVSPTAKEKGNSSSSENLNIVVNDSVHKTEHLEQQKSVESKNNLANKIKTVPQNLQEADRLQQESVINNRERVTSDSENLQNTSSDSPSNLNKCSSYENIYVNVSFTDSFVSPDDSWHISLTPSSKDQTHLSPSSVEELQVLNDINAENNVNVLPSDQHITELSNKKFPSTSSPRQEAEDKVPDPDQEKSVRSENEKHSFSKYFTDSVWNNSLNEFHLSSSLEVSNTDKSLQNGSVSENQLTTSPDAKERLTESEDKNVILKNSETETKVETPDSKVCEKQIDHLVSKNSVEELILDKVQENYETNVADVVEEIKSDSFDSSTQTGSEKSSANNLVPQVNENISIKNEVIKESVLHEKIVSAEASSVKTVSDNTGKSSDLCTVETNEKVTTTDNAVDAPTLVETDDKTIISVTSSSDRDTVQTVQDINTKDTVTVEHTEPLKISEDIKDFKDRNSSVVSISGACESSTDDNIPVTEITEEVLHKVVNVRNEQLVPERPVIIQHVEKERNPKFTSVEKENQLGLTHTEELKSILNLQNKAMDSNKMTEDNGELKVQTAVMSRNEVDIPVTAVVKNDQLHLMETEFSDNSDGEDFKATFIPKASKSYKSDENANLEDSGTVQLLSYNKSGDVFIGDSETVPMESVTDEELVLVESHANLSSAVPLYEIESSIEPASMSTTETPPLPHSEPPPLPLSEPPPLPLSEPPILPSSEPPEERVSVSVTSNSPAHFSHKKKPPVPSKLLIKPTVEDLMVEKTEDEQNKAPVNEAPLTPAVNGSEDKAPASTLDISRRKVNGDCSVEKAQKLVNNMEPHVYIRRQGNNTSTKVLAKELYDHLTREEELELERRDLISQMRVKRRSIDSWTRSPDGTPILISPQSPPILLGDVDSSPISNQELTKKHWEENIISEKEKDSNRRSDQESEWADGVDVNLKLRKQRYEQEESIKSSQEEVEEYESAIDREVRLALEREKRLKEEQEQRQKEKVIQQQEEIQVKRKDSPPKQTMPITKVPPPRQNLPSQTRYTQQTHKEVIISSQAVPSYHASPPPADHGSDSGRPESIIEREIREQQEREEMLRYEKGFIINGGQGDKEREQSEYERQEKEQERIDAHESIIEREIRIQQEREAAIERERQRTKGRFTTSYNRMSSHEDSSAVPPLSSSPLPPQPTSPPPQPPPLVELEEQRPDSRHHSMESSSSRQSSSLASPSLTQIDQVHYEAAISSKAHTGESLIARELREMKEREEEIRRMHRQVGVKVAEDNVDSWETPASESAVYNITHMPVVNQQTSQQKHEAVHKSSSLDSELSSASSTEAHRVTTPSRDAKVKVQPWRDESDQEPTVRYSSTLRSETPVEREIRLARERDNELRKERGLPPKQESIDKSIPIELKETEIPRPSFLYRKGEEDNQRGTMKKMATVRLQKEIESERHRELALRNEGKIHTTSEERVGELMKFVEVIPPKGSADIYSNKPRGVTPTRATHRPVVGVVDTKPTSDAGQQPVAKSAIQQQEKVIEIVPSEPLQNGTPRHEVDIVKRVEKERIQPIRETAVRVQSRSPHIHSNGSIIRKSSKTTESKIEQELREMKEREDELRRQRRIINREPYLELEAKEAEMALAEGLTSEFAAHHLDEVQLRHRSHGDHPGGKNVKRRSALAEEWEKKFAAQM